MIDKKNFLQADCPSQPDCPVVKIRTFAIAKHFTDAIAKHFTGATAKHFTSVVVASFSLALPGALVILAAPLSAQAQNCAVSYEPGTPLQRISNGLFDGRVGPMKVVNNTENATIISLYHPDLPKQVFKYWYAEPGKSYLLGTDNYSSDWGVQVDDGPICLVGRVASWDGSTFTTFPSRLFIVDAPLATALPSTRDATRTSQPTIAYRLLPQTPAAYEAIALKQLTEGEIRSSLITLLRAADLYRASGQVEAEKRVRDRIKQIRGS